MTPSRIDRYILDDAGEPVPEPDLLAWARWLEDATTDRQVAFDELPGGVWVSTVFLGLDHGFSRMFGHEDADAPPVLWETIVFTGSEAGEMRRYTSRAEALAGHAEIVRGLRGGRGEG